MVFEEGASAGPLISHKEGTDAARRYIASTFANSLRILQDGSSKLDGDVNLIHIERSGMRYLSITYLMQVFDKYGGHDIFFFIR